MAKGREKNTIKAFNVFAPYRPVFTRVLVLKGMSADKLKRMNIQTLVTTFYEVVIMGKTPPAFDQLGFIDPVTLTTIITAVASWIKSAIDKKKTKTQTAEEKAATDVIENDPEVVKAAEKAPKVEDVLSQIEDQKTKENVGSFVIDNALQIAIVFGALLALIIFFAQKK